MNPFLSKNSKPKQTVLNSIFPSTLPKNTRAPVSISKSNQSYATNNNHSRLKELSKPKNNISQKLHN
jgi:hypothetical protein